MRQGITPELIERFSEVLAEASAQRRSIVLWVDDDGFFNIGESEEYEPGSWIGTADADLCSAIENFVQMAEASASSASSDIPRDCL